jgi:hypothetical protein
VAARRLRHQPDPPAPDPPGEDPLRRRQQLHRRVTAQDGGARVSALPGRSPSSAAIITDLPQPLSPTSATHSPTRRSKDTSVTAATAPRGTRRRTDRSRTARCS